MRNPGRTLAVACLALSIGVCSALSADKAVTALDQKMNVEFVKTPLSDIADYFTDYHEVEFKFAPNAEKAKAILVTYKAKDVTLRSVLNQILTPHKLKFEAQRDTILIAP